MVGLAVQRALLDVGHRAVERAVVILIHRERTQALTGRNTRLQGKLRQFIIGRKNPAVTTAQRDMHGAGQCREINHHIGLGARRQRQRVGQHHATFGVGMDDLDRGAVQRGDDVVLLVRARPDVVLRQRQPAVDVDLQFRRGRRHEYAQRHRGTVHVFVHAVHVTRRLQVVATGIKADALAHQRHGFIRATRPVTQAHDGGIRHVAALRHRAERTGAHALELFEIVFLANPALRLRQRSQTFAVGPRRQLIRRQHGQFTAQHIAFRRGARLRKTIGRPMTKKRYGFQRFRIGFFLALRQGNAVDPGHINRALGQLVPDRCRPGDHDGQCFGLFGQQRADRLAQQRVLLERRLRYIRRHP